MTQSATTRRDVMRLGTSAIACAAGAGMMMPTVATAEPTGATASNVSPELLQLIAEVDRLQGASDAHSRDVYMPAYERMTAAVEEAKRTLPHTTVSNDANAAGGTLRWATDNPTAVAMCKAIGKRGSATAARNPKAYTDARKLVAAHLRRERAIKALRESFGVGALVDESNAICDATAKAEEAVAGFPAATFADLRAKVAFMHSRNMGDGNDRLPTMLGDLDRLAMVEG